MQEAAVVTGMILKAEPIGEYDKRLVILTMERGKITAFARGVRRINSKLMGAACPFSFGKFKVIEGRNAYSLADIEVIQYFEELRNDFEAAYYGMYFMEMADYYGRENNDDAMMCKLLYVACLALTKPVFSKELVRAVYEIKLIVINGEFPGYPAEHKLDPSTVYTLQYIVSHDVTKLFQFTVNDTVLRELQSLSREYCKRCINHTFKSLQIIESIK